MVFHKKYIRLWKKTELKAILPLSLQSLSTISWNFLILSKKSSQYYSLSYSWNEKYFLESFYPSKWNLRKIVCKRVSRLECYVKSDSINVVFNNKEIGLWQKTELEPIWSLLLPSLATTSLNFLIISKKSNQYDSLSFWNEAYFLESFYPYNIYVPTECTLLDRKNSKCHSIITKV